MDLSNIEQINRSIACIEDRIFESLNIEEIAKEAGMSKWHFQRVFRAMVGDTVKEYVLKRKLSLAAKELIGTDKKIIDIAMTYQFESHEVFSRAFKRVFNTSPTQFREARPAQYLIPSKPEITLDYLTHLYGGLSMQPVIKKVAEKKVMGYVDQFKSVLDNDSDNQIIIPALWRRFEQSIKSLSEFNYMETVGLISCPTEDSIKMEYLAGVFIDDWQQVPEGFEIRSMPTSEYAEFTHKGAMQNINHTINYIYGSWLPKSGKKRGEGPEIEIYPKYFNPNLPSAEMKILIPICDR